MCTGHDEGERCTWVRVIKEQRRERGKFKLKICFKESTKINVRMQQQNRNEKNHLKKFHLDKLLWKHQYLNTEKKKPS